MGVPTHFKRDLCAVTTTFDRSFSHFLLANNSCNPDPIIRADALEYDRFGLRFVITFIHVLIGEVAL